jgi:hypothetical protein
VPLAPLPISSALARNQSGTQALVSRPLRNNLSQVTAE